jgi:hypothetical protein
VQRLAVATVAALALVACGDDGGGPSERFGSPPTSTDLELTEDWGCGYGFAAGNADQTVGLVIRLSDDLVTDQARLPAEMDLAGDAWEAEVRQGSDLFANWCSDVIEEPEADVDEVLPVVAGTLEITSGQLTQSGSDEPVVAELTGVVAESEDGEELELGDLTVTNGSWGFFAG